MKRCTNWAIGIVFVVLYFGAIGTAVAEPEIIPRVTNFIILADESGSMFEFNRALGKTKARLSKEILLKMNEKIPDMDYTAALQVFLPERTLIGPRKYDRAFFRSKFEKLPTRIDPKKEPVATPLGSAILHLSKILEKFTGKTAIIIITDGLSNIGPPPFASAIKVWSTYPNTCFHIISLADKDEGRRIVRDVAGVNNCALADGRVLLADDAAMDDFVRRIFITEVVEEPPREVTALDAALPAEAPAAIPATVPAAAPPVFNVVYFDFDKTDIKPDEIEYLDQNINLLNANSDLKIQIEGHTDWVGPDDYNQGLSERRARVVYAYLVKKGISPQRMEFVGYGEKRPAISNLTPQGRKLNRRVEIHVVQ